MCPTLMIESKNLLKNLASKFTQKLAQDIASKFVKKSRKYCKIANIGRDWIKKLQLWLFWLILLELALKELRFHGYI